MTESQWLAGESVESMLEHLADALTRRKAVLWSCACLRANWAALDDERSRHMIDVAERLVDDAATDDEFQSATAGANDADDERGAYQTPYWAAESLALTHLNSLTGNAVRYSGTPPATLVALLHEVVGNPWRPIDLRGRPWLTPTALSLAEAAYQERRPDATGSTLDPDRLAVLSDALEEAGCDEQAILSHLREAGPHVRGCWALDLLLDRQ
jgi:hypothetical protein